MSDQKDSEIPRKSHCQQDAIQRETHRGLDRAQLLIRSVGFCALRILFILMLLPIFSKLSDIKSYGFKVKYRKIDRVKSFQELHLKHVNVQN